MTPTDAEALAALATLRAWLSLGSAPAEIYDQTRLPPGVSRDAYLRLHRTRTKERVEGWSRRGKTRLVSAAAWEKEIARETARVRRPETSPVEARAANDSPASVDAKLDAALGIKTRRTTG